MGARDVIYVFVWCFRVREGHEDEMRGSEMEKWIKDVFYELVE